MEAFDDVFPYLHCEVRDALKLYKSLNEINEIRLGLEKPVIITQKGKTQFLPSSSGGRLVTGKSAFMYTVNMLSGGSLYSIEENLKKGFVTIKGGHRVGVCGSAVVSQGRVENIVDISSLCFRICREIRGCADDIYNDISTHGMFSGCLIASPPGYGKTTVLRDLARLIATGRNGTPPKKVGIADERCEIAAMYQGQSRFDLGDCSFVCSGYPKSHSMFLMLRCMCPDVIITDEIASSDEFGAVRELQKCGVSVIASVHALDMDDLFCRFGEKMKHFDSIFFIENKIRGHTVYRRCKGDY